MHKVRHIVKSLIPKRARQYLLVKLGLRDKKTVLSESLNHVINKYYGKDGAKVDGHVSVAIIAKHARTQPKSSAFIRLLSPLMDESVRSKVLVKLYPENTVDFPDHTQVCIVQRTAFTDLVTAKIFVKNARNASIKIVIDVDDNLALVDKNHPEYHSHKKSVEAMEYVVKSADQVWVSTARLADIYKRARAHVVHLPNAVDRRLWGYKNVKSQMKVPNGIMKFVYMGTATHGADFDMILPALDRLDAAFPHSFQLTVIGVADNLPERSWLKIAGKGGQLYPLFVDWFKRRQRYDVGLSPLKKTTFNEGKSDIKGIDYLMCGILPVCSDLEPYDTALMKGFVVKVGYGEDDWYQALASQLQNLPRIRAEREKRYSRFIARVAESRTSTHVARKMVAQINKLIAN